MSGRPASSKPIGGGTRFRRLEEREASTAPLLVAWAMGLVLGALAGLAAGAWEAALLRGAGIAYAQGDGLLRAIVANVALGGLLGLAAAATGLWAARWSLAAALLAVGWLASGRVAAALSDAGVPGLAGLAIGLAAAFALGQLAARMPAPAWLHQGVASFLVASVALLGPLQVHLIPDGSSAGALAIGGLALLGAGALAGASAAFAAEGRPPVLPVLGFLSLGAGAAMVATARPPATWTGTKPGPQVVVVVASGLRADRTGFGGHDRARTPALDALAARSVRYDEAHATSNWTVPSLASVLTGRLPYGHGAGLNSGRGAEDSALRPDVRTLAQVLRDDGFATAAVVADPRLRRYALDAGFQAWRDDPAPGVRPTALVPLAAAGLDPTRWPRSSEAGRVTDRALELLGSAPSSGWLLLVQYADAGGPFLTSAQDEAAVGLSTRPWPNDRYDAAVHRVDRELGRLLAGVPPDAWVVVLGDRGVWLGEERPAAAWGRPKARYGGTMYEELLHVPLLVRSPGRDGSRGAEPVSLVDVAPTLLQVFGVEGLLRADGLPLTRVFGGEADPHRGLVAQSSLFGVEQQAVIVGRHKLVQTTDGRTPLYDRVEDPNENSPLRKDAELDGLQRKLLAVLPPPGAGATLQAPPPLVLQVGQIASRYATGGSP